MECQMKIDCCLADKYKVVFEKIDSRISHKCVECHQKILPGNIVQIYIGLDSHDNKKSVHSTCLDCLSIRNNLFNGWIFGTIWAELEYEIEATNGEIPEDCLRSLTPSARSMVCNLIEEYWEKLAE
jgi:hypothetical protein